MKSKAILTLIALLLIGLHINMKLMNSSHEITYDRESAVPLSTLADPEKSPNNCDNRRGLNVVINAGEVAYLDESTNIDHLTIFGELHCDSEMAANITELKVKSIHVHGVFQCGTAQNPYNKKMIISLKHDDVDVRSNDSYRGIMVMNGGTLNLNGNRKNAGWLKLDQTALPGDQSIVVDTGHAVAQSHSSTAKMAFSQIGPNWSVGDKIVLGPTGFNYQEAEEFIITSIDPKRSNRVYLDRPIQFQHWGEKQTFSTNAMGNVTLDERAEVANLTRSILIRADETNGPIDESNTASGQLGGHIMVMFGGKAYVDSVELYKMGQAGIMARYPFHWHFVANAPGQYIKNSSIHHSFQRCVTIHRTHQTLVQNNVCYNFKGHGYFFEDGNEIQNQMIKNLAIMAKPPSSTKLLLASDNILQSESQGRFPSVSAFWISNPNNIIRHNVASGSVGTGFWMSFENEVKNGAGAVVARPITTATAEFNYNIAHSSKVGITWDGAPTGALTNNPNNPLDRAIQSAHYAPPVTPTFIGLRAYKNRQTGIYFRGDTIVYKNTIVADNGWSFWLAYNQIIKDSVFIGRTDNSTIEDDEFFYLNTTVARYRRPAIVLYDGPFEIHDSDFINYDTQPVSANVNGTTFDVTTTPFTITGGTNKFLNVVSGLSFSPEPKHRALLEDPHRRSDRQYLGNSIIRDLDGSLTGTGQSSVLVGKRSLGITPQSGCIDAGESLYNYKICPHNYTEGSQTFMRWGWGPWATPFIVRRSDGALNYPKEEWGNISGSPNNLFATVNNTNYSYEIMPPFQYENDKTFYSKTSMDANTESLNPIQPIIKVTAYGNNCKLGNDAVKVNSLAQLKTQTVTSYYTNALDFYVRIIPKNLWAGTGLNPLTQATALSTLDTRYSITCDEGYLPKVVKGKIEKVLRTSATTQVQGWACNFTHGGPIKVKLYAYGPLIADRATKLRSVAKVINGYTFIAEANSNLSSDPSVAFHCGRMSAAGRNFTFNLNNVDLNKFNNHRFYVQGISNTGGANIYLEKSGIFQVKYDPIKPVEAESIKYSF